MDVLFELDKFELFAKLPTELRFKIIEHSMVPRLIEVRFKRDGRKSEHRFHAKKVPLLHVNQEIRNETLKKYEIVSVIEAEGILIIADHDRLSNTPSHSISAISILSWIAYSCLYLVCTTQSKYLLRRFQYWSGHEKLTHQSHTKCFSNIASESKLISLKSLRSNVPDSTAIPRSHSVSKSSKALLS